MDEKKLKKKYKSKDSYGMNLSYKPKAIQNVRYNLNKNIVYIFNGITFDKKIAFCIFSNKHNHVTFENCTFTKSVYIIEAENVTFINNRSSENRIRCFTSRTKVNKVGHVKFVNDHTLSSGFPGSTYIDFNCETLEMNETDFHGDKPSINVNKLVMNDSNIEGATSVEINADILEKKNSIIGSLYEININVKEYNDFSNVIAPNIVYNGLDLFKHNNSFEYIDKLKEERQKLVDTLATIKVAEEQYQKDEVNRYRSELKKSPLSRTLKRK